MPAAITPLLYLELACSPLVGRKLIQTKFNEAPEVGARSGNVQLICRIKGAANHSQHHSRKLLQGLRKLLNRVLHLACSRALVASNFIIFFDRTIGGKCAFGHS